MPRRFVMVAVSTGCELSWVGKAEGGPGAPRPWGSLAPAWYPRAGEHISLFPRTGPLNSVQTSGEIRDLTALSPESVTPICIKHGVREQKRWVVCFLSPAPRRAGEPLESHTGEGPRRPLPALEPWPPGRIHAWGLRVTRQEGARARGCSVPTEGEWTLRLLRRGGADGAAADGAEKRPRAELRADPHPTPGEAPPSSGPLAHWWRQRAYRR